MAGLNPAFSLLFRKINLMSVADLPIWTQI